MSALLISSACVPEDYSEKLCATCLLGVELIRWLTTDKKGLVMMLEVGSTTSGVYVSVVLGCW